MYIFIFIFIFVCVCVCNTHTQTHTHTHTHMFITFLFRMCACSPANNDQSPRHCALFSKTKHMCKAHQQSTTNMDADAQQRPSTCLSLRLRARTYSLWSKEERTIPSIPFSSRTKTNPAQWGSHTLARMSTFGTHRNMSAPCGKELLLPISSVSYTHRRRDVPWQCSDSTVTPANTCTQHAGVHGLNDNYLAEIANKGHTPLMSTSAATTLRLSGGGLFKKLSKNMPLDHAEKVFFRRVREVGLHQAIEEKEGGPTRRDLAEQRNKFAGKNTIMSGPGAKSKRTKERMARRLEILAASKGKILRNGVCAWVHAYVCVRLCAYKYTWMHTHGNLWFVHVPYAYADARVHTHAHSHAMHMHMHICTHTAFTYTKPTFNKPLCLNVFLISHN
jgi:hypothetical protein